MSRSTFFGFDIATRGLYTAQRGLTNVNHNIDNINTPGYSRQKITQTASRPLLMADGTGMLGPGADVTGVFVFATCILIQNTEAKRSTLGNGI